MVARRVVALTLTGLIAAACSEPPPGPSGNGGDTPDPPRIACPSAVSVMSPMSTPVTVVYGAPSTIGGASPVATICTPQSGGLYAVGTTTVMCTATDTRQRTDSCSFAVTVQKPAVIAATKFMAFGDSITAGEDGQSLFQRWPSPAWPWQSPSIIIASQAYPSVLQTLLASRYLGQAPAILVANQGSRSERAGTPDALTRFSSAMAALRPDVVLLLEGSNDIFEGNASEIPPAITNLRTMIGIARGNQAKPYLATVPPMDPGTDRGRLGYATVQPLNDRLKDLAGEQGVPLVDVHAAFHGNLTLLTDGLHPTQEGYALVAETFFTALRATLETSGPMDAPLLQAKRSH